MADGPAQAVATERIIPIKPTRSDLINIENKVPPQSDASNGNQKNSCRRTSNTQGQTPTIAGGEARTHSILRMLSCRAKSRHLSIFFVGTQMSSRLQTSNAERSNSNA